MTDYLYNEHFKPKKMMPEMNSWLQNLEFTHFVTLAFNRNETIDSARKRLSKFHARLDRKILGSDYYKKAKEQRTFFIAFPEHIQSNFHYHLLVRIKKENEFKFNKYAQNIWSSLVATSSSDIQSFKAVEDPSRYIPYSLKEQYQARNFQSFVISHEFLK